MKFEARPDDVLNVEAPSTVILCFILAIVLGYFTGRTVRVCDRSDTE
jgi:hypothetical protein